MKKNYSKEIEKLILAIGGKKNVSSAMHCVSRLRLVIHDMEMVDIKRIEKFETVKAVIKLPNNQLQIIIGTNVIEYFKEFARQTNIRQSSKEELKKDSRSKGTFVQRIMQHFSEIFIPLIPALVAGGLVLGIRNVFEADFNGWKMVEASAFIKGLNEFLWIPAQAIFWYLPVTITWSIFKKMGGSSVLGIVLGLTMLLPPLLNVYAIAGEGAKWIWNLDLSKFGFNFGAFTFPWKIAYTAQVIPAMGVSFVGVYIERFLNKVITPVLRQILVPLGVILGGYLLAMVIIGPLGWTMGTAISLSFKWLLTNPIAKYIFGPIFGLLYGPLVITGMHHMLNAVMIQNVANIGGTIIFPILAISNIAQGAAALMFTIIHFKNKKIKEVGISATTSAWLGVTEPAMYGINVRFVYPFIGAILGASLGSFLLIISGATASGIGNGAWLGVLSMQAKSEIKNVSTWGGTGYLWFTVSALLTTGVAMSTTMFLSKLNKFQKFERKILNA